VPSRNLDPGVFTVADRRHFTELPVARSDKEYRIVSRQDTSALENPPDHDGKSRRGVKIADPAKFWANRSTSSSSKAEPPKGRLAALDRKHPGR